MKLLIESPHFTPDIKLTDYVEKKITRLEHYYNQILEADIVLKLENSGQVRDKIAEIILRVPGDTIFVKEVDKTFEAAIDTGVDRAKRQLIKHKELQRAHR